MFSKLLFVVTACAALGQSGSVAYSALPRPYNVAEAYEVYSAIISEGYLPVSKFPQRLVITRETKPNPTCPVLHPNTLVSPAFTDYLEQNRQTWWLMSHLHIKPPYELLTEAELRKTSEPDIFEGWKKFYKDHPGAAGITDLSAVGFNPDKTLAVVYLSVICDWLCADGDFRVLQKKNGKWQLLKKTGLACHWVS